MRPLVAALALAVFPAASAASPQDLFAYGGRASAMGGTGATFLDDYAAVHGNPAGLSRARERGLTLGFAATAFDLTTDGRHFPADVGSATVIGLTLPVPFGGILRDRVGVGFGFFTPTNVIVRGRILRPETPQFVLLPDRVQSVAVQLAVGVDLGYGLRVGGGVAALAGLTGSVVVAADATGRASSRIDDQLVASYAPVLGASLDAGPFRFAVVVRGTLTGRFLVTIEARDLGITIPTLNISGVAQYDPAQVHAEAAWVAHGWTLALAGTYKRWSDYPGPVEATTPGSPAPPDPGFSDTVVLRAGAERRWDFPDHTAIAARGGYLYEPSPAPAPGNGRNYLDNDRHALTAGASLSALALGTRYTMDVYTQVHLLAPRTASAGMGTPGSFGGTVLVAGVTTSVTF